MVKFNVTNKVQEAGLILGGLGIIGFLGIIWLMIYGNLSGNLGFGSATPVSFGNESITLSDAGNIPSTADGRTNGVLSLIIVTNASGGEVVPVTNYTVTGVTISNNNSNLYNGTVVNVSATVTFDSDGKVNTDTTIDNVTAGFLTFFGFSNTFFTIAAIVLLIFMLLGLLALVFTIMQLQKGGKKKGFS